MFQLSGILMPTGIQQRNRKDKVEQAQQTYFTTFQAAFRFAELYGRAHVACNSELRLGADLVSAGRAERQFPAAGNH